MASADTRRKQLQPVLAQIEKDKTNPRKKVPVVMLESSLTAIQDYVSGKTDQLPGPLQGPSATTTVLYSEADNIHTTISAETAEAAAAVLGPAALPTWTQRNEGYAMTLSTGQPTHVYTGIYEEPSDIDTWCWLPAAVSVGEAITLALGYTPVKTINRYGSADKDINHMNVLEWWDSAYDPKWIDVWKN